MRSIWRKTPPYLAAVLVSACVVAARSVISGDGERLPGIVYALPIVAAAALGGFWPGLFATSLIVAPAFARIYLRGAASVDLPQMAVFLGVGALLSWLFESLHAAQRRTAERQRQIELEVERRRAAESAERDQRERLRVTLASIGDAVVTTDAEGRVNYLNHPAEILTGWSTRDAAGRPLEEIFHILNEHTRQAVENPVSKVLREGVVVGLANHTVLVARDGAQRPIDDSAAPIRATDGAILGVVLTFRDVSGSRTAEVELRASEERFRSLSACSPVGIFLTDTDGHCTYSNPRCQAICGCTFDEALGHGWTNFLHADDRGDSLQQWLASLQQGQGFSGEMRFQHRDGDVRWTLVRAAPMLSDDGQLLGHVGTIEDITDRKRVEKAVRDSERLHRAIGESIDYGVWVCDAEGRNVYVSDSFLKLVGLTQEQCSEFGWAEVLHPEDAERTVAAWKECVRDQGLWDVEHRCRGVDGQYHPILARGVPVRDEQGKVLWWAGINLDISRLKQTEEALREANRAKDQFLATLAHELRNPLAPLSNALQLWPSIENDRAEMDSLRALMQRQVQQMVRLIDDLLDVSRITRDKIRLRRQRVDLRTVVESAIEASRPAIEMAEHELTVVLHDEPVLVDGDVARLTQVIGNLLNNAAKYTGRHGRVGVAVEAVDRHAVVRITDTGPGIPQEMLERVFDMFVQVDSTLERSHGGLGIGLTLAKSLVELHGGTIEAASAGLGKGSQFIIRLSLADPQSADLSSAGRLEPRRFAPLACRRVLVVDDVQASAKTLAMMLRAIGQEVETANDGATAIDLAMHMKPDLVFLDVAMPGMNGYDVARAMRKCHELRGVVLVALTGYGQPEDRREAFEAGFNHHMVKPAHIDALQDLLSSVPERLAPSGG